MTKTLFGRILLFLFVESFLMLAFSMYPLDFKINSVKTVGYVRAADEDADLGRPTSRSSGQGRNPCLEELIALVPGDGNITASQKCVQSDAALAYTSVSEPTFWIYVPTTKVKKAEFVLIDNDHEIKNYVCKLPEKSGIVGFSLKQYKIEPENVYRWQFSILKKQNKPSENPKVGGKIKLISSMNDLWYDNIDSIAKKRLESDKNNLKNQWSELLDSAGLQQISDLPIAGYCISK